jgi:hypothetical protein
VIDENAFGLFVAHYDLENIEYALEPAAFLEYLGRFASLVDSALAQRPLAKHLRQVELGHGRYLEFADGEQSDSPITWIREMRKCLVEADLPNVCLLTAGGRWLRDPDGPEADPADLDATGPLARMTYGPSEPLRKALAAEALAQPTMPAGEGSATGWGPGLYVEQEAIERLGKSLKNAPTALTVLSSVFYRIGG